MSNSAANTEALIREFVKLSNEHKYEEILSLANPGATWWNAGLKEQNAFAGDKPFEQRIKGIAAVPEGKKLVTKSVDLIVDHNRDKAVVEVEVASEIKNDIAIIFHIKGGKIDKVREYLDFYPILKALKAHGKDISEVTGGN